ncbi:hypothetical protein A3F37_02010 [Candidatus Saccharibacteria bacterium RIFCSPHIGHO2_12_FULL_41_12]|nr:MAG: hypothetical protein A3F37_02010 [Candidatus Saccharibacteria bacterium RIFCSPHIGHO2_12_FULL_41_12]
MNVATVIETRPEQAGQGHSLERINPNSNVFLMVPPQIKILDNGQTVHTLAYEMNEQERLVPVAKVVTTTCEKTVEGEASFPIPWIGGTINDIEIDHKWVDGYLWHKPIFRELRTRRTQRKIARGVLTHLGVDRKRAKEISSQTF